MLDKEKYVWEYWHSFKGTSLENDLKFKDAIFSAFIHGYDRSQDQIRVLQAAITLNDATIDRLRQNRDDCMTRIKLLEHELGEW